MAFVTLGPDLSKQRNPSHSGRPNHYMANARTRQIICTDHPKARPAAHGHLAPDPLEPAGRLYDETTDPASQDSNPPLLGQVIQGILAADPRFSTMRTSDKRRG